MQNLDDSTQNLDQKRLKDDFEVMQYLRTNKNKEQNNENYLKFINELLYHKKHKQTKLDSLFKQIQNINQSQNDRKQQDEELIQSINNQFHHQVSVKGDLERQVQQCKKSIRLMKGDIGHIVKRNQSQKMLSSKINKVNIIASDQFKKVNNEIIKQKEQLKQLKGMRQIFMQRLKNTSRLERNGLFKTQHTFFTLLNHHKRLQTKLNEVKKNGSLIEQYSQLKRKTDNNKQTIIYGTELIIETNKFISSSQEATYNELRQKINQLEQKRSTIQKKLSQFNQIEYISISSQQITQNVQNILASFYLLQNNINSLSTTYYECLKKIENLKERASELDTKNQNINLENIQQLSTKDIQNKLVQQNTLHHLKSLYLFLRFFSLQKDNNQLLLSQLVAYLSNSKQQGLKRQLFSQWNKKIHEALQQIKTVDIEDTTGCFSKMPKSYCSKITLDQTINENQRHNDKRSSKSLMMTEGNQSFFNKEIFYTRKNSRNRLFELSKQTSSRSLLTQNSVEKSKAKRIKFLQRIDQDYYKMLKQTLKMQKEYTGSNYKFMRRFKRQKYVKRDNIYRQKQFESSFSVLWSSKQANISVSQQSKKRPVKSLHNTNNVLKSIPLNKSIKLKSNSIMQSS